MNIILLSARNKCGCGNTAFLAPLLLYVIHEIHESDHAKTRCRETTSRKTRTRTQAAAAGRRRCGNEKAEFSESRRDHGADVEHGVGERARSARAAPGARAILTGAATAD